MSDDPAKSRRRSGRPFQHEDDLRLLLHVEVGCAAAGLSINRFCETFPFRDSHGRRLHTATLKRRYYQRKASLQPAHLPGGVIVPSPMGEAVERYLAEVRSVFASRK
ncbi:hypothetical protein [Rhizorhapis sp.]|uniref:hypothetical protein n=1 Tax=Rhizorhapis sp. TaxID=1968842 RepID=UPI002B497B31|nr:hypothetical protein [Rhizorhapis sp.]HKR15847.1 hypothetical protein [Rhizorhapis sp.]